jgi:uncharacterized protein YjbJ (UPF0337 family)
LRTLFPGRRAGTTRRQEGSDIWRLGAAKFGESTMDWNRFEGNWKQIKGKVKEQWGKLTDDDLDMINGQREQLEGRIQERYGIQKDMVKQQVDDWWARQ